MRLIVATFRQIFFGVHITPLLAILVPELTYRKHVAFAILAQKKRVQIYMVERVITIYI